MSQESVYHNAPAFARRFDGWVQEFLVTLHRKLHEHLNACCGIQGAGVLTSPT